MFKWFTHCKPKMYGDPRMEPFYRWDNLSVPFYAIGNHDNPNAEKDLENFNSHPDVKQNMKENFKK